MKVYIVQEDYDNWEDELHFNEISVFDDLEKAQRSIETMIKTICEMDDRDPEQVHADKTQECELITIGDYSFLISEKEVR